MLPLNPESLHFRRRLFSVIWAVFVMVLCGINGNALPKVSFEIGIDKIAHFLLFGIQCWLLLYGMNPLKVRPVTFAIVVSASYGAVIEAMQATVFVNRTYDYADMLANATGAFAFGIATYWWRNQKS